MGVNNLGPARRRQLVEGDLGQAADGPSDDH
jgi:hypothetical protein